MINELKIEIESYSVIYSVDGPTDFVENNEPDKDVWVETENNESDYIEEWAHKKFVALLTPKQFEDFVNYTGLYAEDCETMGSLGAPGHGFGWSPAISFEGEDYEGVRGAYVTPNVLTSEIKESEDPEIVWQQIRKQVLGEYGY